MDRQTQVVAEAICNAYHYGTGMSQSETCLDASDYIEEAKAAISASDAKYVPELVRALVKVLNRAMVHDHEWYEDVAKTALAKLPEEYRK